MLFNELIVEKVIQLRELGRYRTPVRNPFEIVEQELREHIPRVKAGNANSYNHERFTYLAISVLAEAAKQHRKTPTESQNRIR